ncbi:hypothetical protein FG386_001824 [Cryptosporidium ryanae]|uniref:uncharacterized protein n=1 Tax=Cryptosporidium ryanae TaxID=515981 RepID=UPI00351A76B8|nr:hypothetical protein FG386_001824 [Cryptosporidium ryanae]
MYFSLKNSNFGYFKDYDKYEHGESPLNTEKVNASGNLDMTQIDSKFESIDNSIVNLNKKMSIIIEMNEEKNNNSSKAIEKKMEDKMKIIEDSLFNLGNELVRFKDGVKEEFNGIKKVAYESRKQDFQGDISKVIDSLKSNITEMERMNDNLRIEFENLYQEMKLVDEAQDVLKSMILSINKRAEGQLSLNSAQFSQQSFHFTKEIENYIQDSIRIQYEMRGYNKLDWAQSSMGGKVIYPEKNMYCEIDANKNQISPLIRGIMYIQTIILKHFIKRNAKSDNYHTVPIYKSNCFKPSDIINSNIMKTAGNCLLVPVNSDIIIELSALVNITSIGIDHVLSQLDYDNGETVPRNISIECIQASFEKPKAHYMTYYYPQNGNSLQLNPINPSMVCRKIKFSIISSYGGDHVCLYKLRVYGDLFSNSSSHKYIGSKMRVFNVLRNNIVYGIVLPQLKNSLTLATITIKFTLRYVSALFQDYLKEYISKKVKKESSETDPVETGVDTNDRTHNEYNNKDLDLNVTLNIIKTHQVDNNKKRRERELK